MWELKDTTNPCERVILFIKNFQLSSKEEEYYNAEMGISLRAFPNIEIKLGEIFEGIDV